MVDDLPTSDDEPRWATALDALAALPCVVVGRGAWLDAPAAQLRLVDAAVDDDALGAIVETVRAAPLAACCLALHLRAAPRRSVGEGLAAESALYSTLLAGPEHAAWRAATPRRARPAPRGPSVHVARHGAELAVALARPEVRNALSARMRDELVEALAVALADPELRVTLNGEGPDFCAGGDLDEFGTAPDPATAHVVRLERSLGALLARLADRTTARIHGACYGSGIELPAFAGHVVADPDTTIALPELGMGLIPGAGGTVSLPARIGRHATARLALARRPIDAATALAWGLVDEIAEATSL